MRRHPAKARRGSMLVAALWILAALAGLVGTMSLYVRDTNASLQLEVDHLRAAAMTESAAGLAASHVANTDETHAAQGHIETDFGQGHVALEYSGETARIDINFAAQDLLKNLFLTLGAKDYDATDYAGWIADWRAPAPTAQSPAETNSNVRPAPFAPRHRPFGDVSELIFTGVPEHMVRMAAPYLTTYSGRASIDPRLAVPEILQALPKMTPETLKALLALHEREQADIKSLQALLSAQTDFISFAPARALRVDVAATLPDGFTTHAQITIIRFLNDSQPYRILNWHDRLENNRLLSEQPASAGHLRDGPRE